MRVGSFEEAWPQYCEWVPNASPPPAGIWAMEGDSLAGGCFLYDGEGMAVASWFAVSPAFSEDGAVKVLSFMLTVLEGHCKVVGRAPLVSLGGLEHLAARLPLVSAGLWTTGKVAPSGVHNAPDGPDALPGEAVDACCETASAPTEGEPTPKPRARARAKKK